MGITLTCPVLINTLSVSVLLIRAIESFGSNRTVFEQLVAALLYLLFSVVDTIMFLCILAGKLCFSKFYFNIGANFGSFNKMFPTPLEI